MKVVAWSTTGKRSDGSFRLPMTTFDSLVAFKAAAEQGHERLAKGDKVIADGYVREYSYQRDGQNVEGEEFVARRLGHDMARTRYDVDRTPCRSPPERDATAFTAPEHRPATASPAAVSP